MNLDFLILCQTVRRSSTCDSFSVGSCTLNRHSNGKRLNCCLSSFKSGTDGALLGTALWIWPIPGVVVATALLTETGNRKWQLRDNPQGG
jgi:hypothetical protein